MTHPIECTGTPPTLTGATSDFVAGTSPITEGSTITYTCTSDSSTDTSTCQSDGMWSALSHTCPAGTYDVNFLSFNSRVICW